MPFSFHPFSFTLDTTHGQRHSFQVPFSSVFQCVNRNINNNNSDCFSGSKKRKNHLVQIVSCGHIVCTACARKLQVIFFFFVKFPFFFFFFFFLFFFFFFFFFSFFFFFFL